MSKRLLSSAHPLHFHRSPTSDHVTVLTWKPPSRCHNHRSHRTPSQSIARTSRGAAKTRLVANATGVASGRTRREANCIHNHGPNVFLERVGGLCHKLSCRMRNQSDPIERNLYRSQRRAALATRKHQRSKHVAARYRLDTLLGTQGCCTMHTSRTDCTDGGGTFADNRQGSLGRTPRSSVHTDRQRLGPHVRAALAHGLPRFTSQHIGALVLMKCHRATRAASNPLTIAHAAAKQQPLFV